MKKLSVILIVKDQADTLRDTLPQLLSQQCEGGHEVIVVDATPPTHRRRGLRC